MADDVNAAAREFVRWAVQIAWEGGDVDGCDIQAKATSLSLIVETKYDPAVHGEPACDCVDVEPGDPWYVFRDEMKEA